MSPETITVLIATPALLLGGLIGIRLGNRRVVRLRSRATARVARQLLWMLSTFAIGFFVLGVLLLADDASDRFALGLACMMIALAWAWLSGNWYGRLCEARLVVDDLGLEAGPQIPRR